jgi:hypothetical protein
MAEKDEERSPIREADTAGETAGLGSEPALEMAERGTEAARRTADADADADTSTADASTVDLTQEEVDLARQESAFDARDAAASENLADEVIAADAHNDAGL